VWRWWDSFVRDEHQHAGDDRRRRGQAAGTEEFAQSISLQRVSGTVLVKLPGSARFVPLSAARQVLVGTVVDVRGWRRPTAAYPIPGQSAIGDFQAGVFEVKQNRAGGGRTTLRIEDTQSERAGCAGAHGASQLGLLLGDATGRFRTDGRFSAATVRGTKWGVRDRCDGTLTIVRRGVMVVTDFRLHKNVLLHAGQTYLAKAP
jgi:hypothetical protein